MESDLNRIDPENLPFDLPPIEQQYGPIRQAELRCPGVYFLRTVPPEGFKTSTWLYVVTADAPVTREARKYGRPVPGHPELCLFEYEDRDCNWKIIEYEILRCRKKNKLPLGKWETLRSAAADGMEVRPEYFGTYPVPILTPWGQTVRHKAIHNGVYWIETDRGASALAVCYRLRDDLSELALSLSELTPYDRERGLDNTLGYSFFREGVICLPLLELMLENGGWDWSLIDKPALMNAVWTAFPEYAAAHNMREQRGENDAFGMMLLSLGIGTPLRSSPENLIMLTPDAGPGFLKFL